MIKAALNAIETESEVEQGLSPVRQFTDFFFV